MLFESLGYQSVVVKQKCLNCLGESVKIFLNCIFFQIVACFPVAHKKQSYQWNSIRRYKLLHTHDLHTFWQVLDNTTVLIGRQLYNQNNLLKIYTLSRKERTSLHCEQRKCDIQAFSTYSKWRQMLVSMYLLEVGEFGWSSQLQEKRRRREVVEEGWKVS